MEVTIRTCGAHLRIRSNNTQGKTSILQQKILLKYRATPESRLIVTKYFDSVEKGLNDIDFAIVPFTTQRQLMQLYA